MKRALALDLDDILYPFMPTLVPFYNKRFGTTYSPDDYVSFWFETLWQTSAEEAGRRIDLCFAELDEQDAHPDPMDGAERAILELREHFRLFIVTSRSDEFHSRTIKWLDKHFPSTFDDVFLCNSYITEPGRAVRTKGSVVAELDAVGLVDDSVSNVTEVVDMGRLGVLFGDYPWNRESSLPTAARRARTWAEVTEILLKEHS